MKLVAVCISYKYAELLDEPRTQVKDIVRKKRRNLNSQATKVNRVLASFPKQKLKLISDLPLFLVSIVSNTYTFINS